MPEETPEPPDIIDPPANPPAKMRVWEGAIPSVKQQEFAEMVIEGIPPNVAASRAGYGHPAKMAAELMRSPTVEKYLRERLEIKGISADDALEAIKRAITAKLYREVTEAEACGWNKQGKPIRWKAVTRSIEVDNHEVQLKAADRILSLLALDLNRQLDREARLEAMKAKVSVNVGTGKNAAGNAETNVNVEVTNGDAYITEDVSDMTDEQVQDFLRRRRQEIRERDKKDG